MQLHTESLRMNWSPYYKRTIGYTQSTLCRLLSAVWGVLEVFLQTLLCLHTPLHTELEDVTDKAGKGDYAFKTSKANVSWSSFCPTPFKLMCSWRHHGDAASPNPQSKSQMTMHQDVTNTARLSAGHVENSRLSYCWCSVLQVWMRQDRDTVWCNLMSVHAELWI